MSEHPYEHYQGVSKENMVLRDYLAVDRTIMANESSFLSYIRTALTMIVAAVTFLKFFSSPAMHVLGWIFIVCAVLMVIHGATRYEAVEKVLNNLTGDIKNHPDARTAGPAQRLLIASQSLLGLFR